MAIIEDKIASLFRRVRRLQQSAFARFGDYFEEALPYQQLFVREWFSSILRAPFVEFEETLSLTFALVVRFTANVVFESMSSTARLMVLIDAYVEALDQLEGLLRIMVPFTEAIDLTEQFNALLLWMPGSNDVSLSLYIEVKLIDTFTNSSVLWMHITELESIDLTETVLHKLWLPAPNVVFSETLSILIKVIDGLDQLVGLLWMKQLVSESVSVTETNLSKLSLIASNAITEGISLVLTLTESLTDLQGVLWVMTPFTEPTVTLGESFNAMHLWLPATSDVTVVLSSIAASTVTLVDTFGSTGLLWMGGIFTELVDITDTFNAMYLSMVATSTMVDGFVLILWLLESIANSGLASAMAMQVEAISTADAFNYMDLYGVASTTVTDVLSYITSALIVLADSFSSSGLMSVLAPFNDSVDMSDTLEAVFMFGVASTTITENLISIYVPVLSDSFTATGLMMMQLLDSSSMSVSDALDYVDMRGVPDNSSISVDFDCIKSCPSCYNCDTCEACAAGACDVCNNCEGGCDVCDTCIGCNESCQSSCQTCVTCISCQSCVTCEFCDSGCNNCYTVCDLCDTCDGCQVCNICDACDNCDNCDVSCYTCNQPCYLCDSCDTCDACATCNTCQTCYSSCEQCDSFCQTCATCYAGCYACDECNNTCELCYQE